MNLSRSNTRSTGLTARSAVELFVLGCTGITRCVSSGMNKLDNQSISTKFQKSRGPPRRL
uniref:Uncharacterized protein n=2 Tax=Helianthus annuus TaxID=4232 RepID=A0A251TKX6_HELAN